MNALTLNWEPSGGTLGFVTDRELPPESPPFDDYDEQPVTAVPKATDKLPPPPTLYNVYRDQEPDPFDPPPPRTASIWNTPAPKPLNPAPTPLFTLTDPLQIGRRSCYTVRAVRGAGPQAAESEPTPPLCVMPVDVFPPAPPRSLAAVPAGNAINLIWEASDAPDAAGYLVLRGAPGDDTLLTLTPSPVTEARYRDASVKPGVAYVYAVVAVDNRLPLPNVSAESNRVQETAR